MRWTVVIPVKGGARAKSRLQAPEGVDRLALARALALDTVAAAVAAQLVEVVVVTADLELAAAVESLGARVVTDGAEGLDAAVRRGAAASRTDHVAALLGDLPALRAGDLVAALAAAGSYDRAVVPDADGIGTVLLTAVTPSALRPRFGGASAAAHVGEGAVRLDLDLPRLRRDVDEATSLEAAVSLGVGPHTAALLSSRTA